MEQEQETPPEKEEMADGLEQEHIQSVIEAVEAQDAGLWFGFPMLGAVIAMAMALTLIAAALGGIVIPIVLERLNIDPALASGPFVTTITHVVGFFVFLGLASLILL